MDKIRVPKVLVADDSPTVTDILSYLFTEEGYDVTVAQDGMFAIREFYADPPDLMILDVEMPRMDGYQVCRILKDDQRVSSVPIIMLTSHDAQSDRFRGLSSGADAYIVKNLEDGRLLTEVRRLIRQSPWLEMDRPEIETVNEEEVLHRLNNMLDRRLFLSSVVNQLQQLGRQIASLDTAIDGVLELYSQIFEFVVGGLVLISDNGNRFHVLKVAEFDDILVDKLVTGIREYALKSGIDWSKDIEVRARVIRIDKGRNFPRTTDLISCHYWALESHGQTIGILGMGSTATTKFDPNGTELINEFVSHASILLDNAQLLHSLADRNEHLNAAITELQSTQTQLIQSEKMASIGQLTAGLVHEMNNPLNFIAGNLEHIDEYSKVLLRLAGNTSEQTIPDSNDNMQPYDSPEDIEFIREDLPDMLKDMREGLIRAQKIITDLRTFSSGDRGTLTSTDLREVVESTLNIIRYRWQDRIAISKNFDDIPSIECNSGQIGQVVLNLIVNAIDAVEDKNEEAQIDLTLGSNDNVVTLEVSDNGVGIDAKNLESLFQPFFTTKDVGGGMGLGLSISKSIMNNHGGDILVSSKIGEGTVFTITLPRS